MVSAYESHKGQKECPYTTKIVTCQEGYCINCLWFEKWLEYWSRQIDVSIFDIMDD